MRRQGFVVILMGAVSVGVGCKSSKPAPEAPPPPAVDAGRSLRPVSTFASIALPSVSPKRVRPAPRLAGLPHPTACPSDRLR